MIGGGGGRSLLLSLLPLLLLLPTAGIFMAVEEGTFCILVLVVVAAVVSTVASCPVVAGFIRPALAASAASRAFRSDIIYGCNRIHAKRSREGGLRMVGLIVLCNSNAESLL